jgi:hypothetical protein
MLMTYFPSIDLANGSGGRRCFVVAQDDLGHWIAREKQGRVGGIFRSRREAIRFALFETGNRASAVVVDTAAGSRR